MSATVTVRRLLKDIEAILERDNKTIADLAKDIGRGYHQVYSWLRVRRFNPNASGLMLLMQWRNDNLFAANGEPRREPTAGKKNEATEI